MFELQGRLNKPLKVCVSLYINACVCVCNLPTVSACPARCSRGRTTAPTPVGGAQMLSRGRRLLRSSRAPSSGTRPSPKRRRPKSPARPLPSSPPAPRGNAQCSQPVPLWVLCCVCGRAARVVPVFKLLRCHGNILRPTPLRVRR